MPVSRKTLTATATVEEASRLRRLGFGICRILAKEKTPTYKGWTRASLEPGDFDRYPTANLGILGGTLSGNLVVVDPDRPEIRAEAAKRLPRTMTDGRPSSGPGHLYYRVTDVPDWATSPTPWASPSAWTSWGPGHRRFARRLSTIPASAGAGLSSRSISSPCPTSTCGPSSSNLHRTSAPSTPTGSTNVPVQPRPSRASHGYLMTAPSSALSPTWRVVRRPSVGRAATTLPCGRRGASSGASTSAPVPVSICYKSTTTCAATRPGRTRSCCTSARTPTTRRSTSRGAGSATGTGALQVLTQQVP